MPSPKWPRCNRGIRASPGQRERRLSDGLLIDEQEEEEAAELQARLAALSYPLSPGPQEMEVDAEAGDVAGAP